MTDRICENTDCDLPAHFTDPSLKGKWYCKHHRERATNFNQEQKVRDLEKDRDSWRRTAEKLEVEKRDLAAELGKMVEKLKSIQNMSRPGWGN